MKQTSSIKVPVTSNDPTAVTNNDAPKLTQANFDNAKLRVAGRDVNRAEWQVAVRSQVGDKPLHRVIREELSHQIRLRPLSEMRRQLSLSYQTNA